MTKSKYLCTKSDILLLLTVKLIHFPKMNFKWITFNRETKSLEKLLIHPSANLSAMKMY